MTIARVAMRFTHFPRVDDIKNLKMELEKKIPYWANNAKCTFTMSRATLNILSAYLPSDLFKCDIWNNAYYLLGYRVELDDIVDNCIELQAEYNEYNQYEYLAMGTINRDKVSAIIDKGETENMVEIEKVVFNNPATIVFWSDKTKTVVKCGENDIFDEEKGLAMAISKKLLGKNKGNYNNVFKKWCTNRPVDKKDTIRASYYTTYIPSCKDWTDNAVVRYCDKLCEADKLMCENCVFEGMRDCYKNENIDDVRKALDKYLLLEHFGYNEVKEVL